ncbi:MAG: hypothetical protein AABY64_14680, partial [Bdellovibrionota bacterium]
SLIKSVTLKTLHFEVEEGTIACVVAAIERRGKEINDFKARKPEVMLLSENQNYKNSAFHQR